MLSVINTASIMLKKIINYNLCIGCGLCESILGQQKCTMKLDANGFYTPVVRGGLTSQENHLINKICPGVRVEGPRSKGSWGSLKFICQAWAADKEIRHKAASGGIITSLAVYLLEEKMVSAVLQVGVRDDSYLYNELRVSRNKDDVIRNAQSRYAPALVFHNIKELLDSEKGSFALIGKPCDMAAMQNFIREFPQYNGRIKYFLSIFCAGMPSYNATIQVWQQSGHKDAPVKLKYRGDGWPGFFRAEFEDGTNYQTSYNDSWGKILGKQLNFRCKICPDGIGMLADISVGDSWNTKNGYPDFSEDDGRCFCMIRTENGTRLFEGAIKKGYIESNYLDINKIEIQQPYQYERRKLEGWRVLAVQFYTQGILHFSGLSIWRQMLDSSFRVGIRNMVGTYIRIRKAHGK